MREFSAVAITGIPGSGKTELAKRLAEAFGWPVISTGDIARRIDPESLAQGQMANEAAFRAAFEEAIYEAEVTDSFPLILDGIPRSPLQADLLPSGTITIGLTCRMDIAIDRQVLRARPGDTPENIGTRTVEQADLLGQNVADGFIYRHCGYGRVVATSMKTPDQIAADVAGYLRGEKKEVY